MEREEIVAALLKASGGQLVGRVRLQKTVYLLDRLGLESGFDYDYHHYGPFSRDIDNAVADAEAFELVEERFGRRQLDGARYSIFKLTDEGYELPAMIGQLDEVELQRLLVTTRASYRRRVRRERFEWPLGDCIPGSPWTGGSLRFGNRLRRTFGCGSTRRLSA